MAIVELAPTDELRFLNFMFGLLCGGFQLPLLWRRCWQMHIYSQREVKCSVLTISGLAVITFGIIICSFVTVGNIRDLSHFDDFDLKRTCRYGMKIATVTYCMLRFSVYIFLIYRIDLVNFDHSKSTFIKVFKWMIVLCDITGVGLALGLSEGTLRDGEVLSCRGYFNPVLLFFVALADFLICFIALMWFLRPLRNINETFTANDMLGDEFVLRLMNKMRFYGYIMIGSTVLAICASGIFGGLPLIYAVDAGVTSLALVLIYEPQDHGFGVRQVSMAVVSTNDLHELTEELKCPSPSATSDVEKTFSSADLDSLSAQKLSVTGNSGPSLNIEEDHRKAASDNSDHELVTEISENREAVEMSGLDSNAKKLDNKEAIVEGHQDTPNGLNQQEIAVDLEKEDSSPDVGNKRNSIIVVKENLKRSQWLLV